MFQQGVFRGHLNLAPRKNEDKIISINKKIREAIGGTALITSVNQMKALDLPEEDKKVMRLEKLFAFKASVFPLVSAPSL